MNKIFHKAAGAVLSSSLVLAGLGILEPSRASAENAPIIPQDSTSEETIYASIESIEIIDETNNSATIEVKLDKNIEDTSMPLSIYEEGTPYAIQKISTGGKNLQFEIEKEAQSKTIYATTGTSTSNSVIVSENRAAATKNFPRPRPAGQSVDEYPFASTYEGGAGAEAMLVPVAEQSYQGGKMSSFIKKHKLTDGDKFGVRII